MRSVLEAQLKAALAKDKAALRATFVAESIVLTPATRKAAYATERDLLGLHGSEVAVSAGSTKLIAGGSGDAVWFYAELTIKTVVGDDREATTSEKTIRVVELLVASESWRAVASSFTTSHKPMPAADNQEIDGATMADGSLAKLVGTGATLACRRTDDLDGASRWSRELTTKCRARRSADLACGRGDRAGDPDKQRAVSGPCP